MAIDYHRPAHDRIGVVVIDHGSKRRESNSLLFDVVEMFRRHSGWTIVEAAHMELAEPSLETAFARCVEQGAELVVVHPYFLLPGAHSTGDIPALAAQAAARYPSVPYRVTAPLGLHPLMAEVMQQRVVECLRFS